MESIIINRVAALALERGVTPTKAMKDAGVGKNFFYNIRSGSVPSSSKIEMIAAYFGVSADYILGTDKPNPHGDEQQFDSETLEVAERFNLLSHENKARMVDYLAYLSSLDKP